MYLKWILWTSIIFYLIACFLNAFKDTKNNKGMYKGGVCLFFGWMSFMFTDWFALIAWFANILYWVSVINYNKTDLLFFVFSISSILSSCLAFFIKKLLINEAGTYVPVKVSWGFYFWLTSMVMGGFYRYFIQYQDVINSLFNFF